MLNACVDRAQGRHGVFALVRWFAVEFMVYFCFGSVCRGTVMLAAIVMLMKDTFGWTFQSGCFDNMAFDTI